MYSKIYIKTVFAVTEMSRDKLFHVGNGHTSFQSLLIYVVRVAVSQSKHIEMGLKSIEMS